MNFQFGRKRALTLATAALALSTVTSCGTADGGETVFLFVINGYTAAETLSVFGNAGPVVQGLKFGERSAEPIEVNRNFGTEFTIVIDGMPEAVELTEELFAMYPQETGTLFVKKRSGTNDISTSLFRHVQTIDPSCQFTFENSLSLSNTNVTGGSFSYLPEFRIEGRAESGYLDETQVPVITECGPLPTPTRDPIPRPALLTAIDNDPYFFYVDCPSDVLSNLICPIFGESENEDEIIGAPPTQEYYECIAGAVTIKQPEGMEPLPFPGADAQVQCPDGALTWDDVQVDPLAVADCKALKKYNATFAKPDDGAEKITYRGIGCEQQFRIRTPGLQVIFGPKDGADLGQHGNGAYVESRIKIPVGSEHFYLLFGRPVNPLIWQWNSGENFVDLGPYPYYNDQNQVIGTTDDL